MERPPALADPDPSAPHTLADDDSERFRTGEIVTIAGGHFIHDTYSAFIAPLLPILRERFETSYALTGALAVFPQLPSLLSPLLGYLADKISLRYFVIFAPAVTATLICLLGLTPDYLTLALLLLAAGVSVTAFHAPAPAMIGAVAGRRVGAGMSLFMAAGELGRTLGPVAAVGGVAWFGLEGIWRLAFAGWAVSALLYWRLSGIVAPPRRGPALPSWQRARRVFPALGFLTLSRALMLAALTTFLPLFMAERSGSLWLAAAALTVLEGAGVAGALLSGTLSDRLGRRRVLAVLFALAPLLLFALVLAPAWLALPILAALGLIAISPTPVILAVVQDQFPDNRALANGSYLALNFLLRALGIWLLGVLADEAGLRQAFLWSGVTAFASLPALLWLPEGARAVRGVRG